MDPTFPSMNARSLAVVSAFSLSTMVLRAQVPDSSHTALYPGRTWATAGIGGSLITGSLIALDQAWYSKYDRVPFHFFDDGLEWRGMDKAGHLFATYTVGRWGYGLLGWCGVPRKTRIWAGGSLGLAYLTAVEYLDGRSAAWGFSWWDMGANVAGSGLFIGQELAWGEQRIVVKYSAHLTDYAPQRPEVLGDGLSERILKDYNGCTFWTSVNLRSFGARSLPPWLNAAAGFGAEGMLHADGDPGSYQQFYLAPDVSLTRIPTKSRFLRTVFFALDCIKIPAPALEFRSNGSVVGHWLYF